MESLSPRHPQRAHLVGIAGNGMRALADVLLGWGWRLSGSDLISPPFPPVGWTSAAQRL